MSILMKILSVNLVICCHLFYITSPSLHYFLNLEMSLINRLFFIQQIKFFGGSLTECKNFNIKILKSVFQWHISIHIVHTPLLERKLVWEKKKLRWYWLKEKAQAELSWAAAAATPLGLHCGSRCHRSSSHISSSRVVTVVKFQNYYLHENILKTHSLKLVASMYACQITISEKVLLSK